MRLGMGRWIRRGVTGAVAVLLVLAGVVVPAGSALAASSWLTVSAGNRFTCGIKSDQTLWCWGSGYHGELGVGDQDTRWTPAQVGSAANWAQVSTGNANACAITTDRALFCWGDGTFGQLGVGYATISTVPVLVDALTNDWVSVSVGTWHTCGVRSDSSLFCWGSNDSGQLGSPGAGSAALAPALVGASGWSKVTAGGDHTCATDTAGQLNCWGGNASGQLGLGDTVPRPTPTPVTSIAWSQLSAGSSYTCAIRGQAVSGPGFCWGLNHRYQLGKGDTTNRSRPTAFGLGWTSVHAGDATTCGIKQTQVWCWGDNTYIQAGPGSGMTAVTPQMVYLPSAAASVAVGLNHTCALLTDGSLWCWGNGLDGELGTGGHYPSGPAQVTG